MRSRSDCRLIVVAILVELGEVIARLIVHATMESGRSASSAVPRLASSDMLQNVTQMSREEALRILEEMVATAAPGTK